MINLKSSQKGVYRQNTDGIAFDNETATYLLNHKSFTWITWSQRKYAKNGAVNASGAGPDFPVSRLNISGGVTLEGLDPNFGFKYWFEGEWHNATSFEVLVCEN
jgi:hypothetical protein